MRTALVYNPISAHAHVSLLLLVKLAAGHALSKRRSGTFVKISRISDEVVRKELPSVAGYRWTNRSYSLLESPSWDGRYVLSITQPMFYYYAI